LRGTFSFSSVFPFLKSKSEFSFLFSGACPFNPFSMFGLFVMFILFIEGTTACSPTSSGLVSVPACDLSATCLPTGSKFGLLLLSIWIMASGHRRN
jgi:hypothetical protein